MRTIVHLDADAFFAAVEQAADPKLRGKPIAVGGERRGIRPGAANEGKKVAFTRRYQGMESAAASRTGCQMRRPYEPEGVVNNFLLKPLDDSE